MMTRAEAAAWLQSHDHFCILTHTRPDGDTVGSSAALCLALRKMGKTAYILENPELSGQLLFLHEGLTKKEISREDVVVSVDVAAVSMLPKDWQAMAGRIELRIDHHENDRSFAPNELVESQMAACAEVVCALIELLGVEMDAKMGEAVYVGVSTDTGCFRFPNTTANSFRVAAACVAAGANIYPLNQMLFDTNTMEKLKVRSWITEHAKFYRDGKVALCALPYEVEKNATEDDMNNISGFLRSIEGVCMAALIRQNPDKCRLSVRAVPGYDAAAVCALFDGGGHKGAAGADLYMTMAEAEKAVEAALLDAVR